MGVFAIVGLGSIGGGIMPISRGNRISSIYGKKLKNELALT